MHVPPLMSWAISTTQILQGLFVICCTGFNAHPVKYRLQSVHQCTHKSCDSFRLVREAEPVADASCWKGNTSSSSVDTAVLQRWNGSAWLEFQARPNCLCAVDSAVLAEESS